MDRLLLEPWTHSEPEKLLKKLHDKKVKLSLNVHPADGIRSMKMRIQLLQNVLDYAASEEPAIFDIAQILALKNLALKMFIIH